MPRARLALRRFRSSAFLANHADLVDDAGRRRLVRNGFLPERTIQTGIGPVPVQQPRVRDRGAGAAGSEPIRFTSAILPCYLVGTHGRGADSR